MTLCLVTGGAGFIGSHLVDGLLGRGYQVRVLDNFSTGTLANLSSARTKVELVFGDISNLEIVREASKGVDVVFHLANPNLGHSLGTQQEKYFSRETGTLHVLIAAHEARVKRVLYASSACVYGPSHLPQGEDDLIQPQTFYGIAKVTGEQQCVAFTTNYGLETVRLRFFNVFGPRQLDTSPYRGRILQIIKAMLLGTSPVIHGDGSQVQDLIYVDDVVHATLLAAEASRVSGRIFNIGRGRPTTALQVVASLNAILHTDFRPFHTSLGPDEELYNRVADVSRAEAELGFCSSTSLEQGLRRCLDYLTTWRLDFLGMGHQLAMEAKAEQETEQLEIPLQKPPQNP